MKLWNSNLPDELKNLYEEAYATRIGGLELKGHGATPEQIKDYKRVTGNDIRTYGLKLQDKNDIDKDKKLTKIKEGIIKWLTQDSLERRNNENSTNHTFKIHRSKKHP